MEERSVNDFFSDKGDNKKVEYQPSNFGERLVAYLIDSIILIAVVLNVLPSALSLLLKLPIAEFASNIVIFLASLLFLYFFWPFIIRTIYSTIFDCSGLQGTPGKIIMGLSVVNLDDQRISFATSLGRNLSKFISAIIFYIGFFMIIFNRDRRSLHDEMSKTKVIRKPTEPSVVKKMWFGLLIMAVSLWFLPGFGSISRDQTSSYMGEMYLKEDMSKVRQGPFEDQDSICQSIHLSLAMLDSNQVDLEEMRLYSEQSVHQVLVLLDHPSFRSAPKAKMVSFLKSISSILKERHPDFHKDLFVGLCHSSFVKASLTPTVLTTDSNDSRKELMKFYED